MEKKIRIVTFTILTLLVSAYLYFFLNSRGALISLVFTGVLVVVLSNHICEVAMQRRKDLNLKHIRPRALLFLGAIGFIGALLIFLSLLTPVYFYTLGGLFILWLPLDWLFLKTQMKCSLLGTIFHIFLILLGMNADIHMTIFGVSSVHSTFLSSSLIGLSILVPVALLVSSRMFR